MRPEGDYGVRKRSFRPRCDYGVRKRSFRLMLKLTLQHSKSIGARLPSPTLWERGAARQRFWSAEASASASGGSCASALHNHSVSAGCRGARWCALRFLPRSSVANRRTLISLKHGAVEPRTRNHAKSPRNCPKFPQNRPFPLDIRAKVCYTMHVIGANPE